MFEVEMAEAASENVIVLVFALFFASVMTRE
jgi:hypothetical protein